MSIPWNYAAFTPDRVTNWLLCEGTAAGAAVAWTHPKAMLALDFLNDRHAKAGVRLPHGRVLSTVRSSTALMLDGTGRYRSFSGNAAPVVPGLGNDVWGQFGNLLHASTMFTTPLLWTKYGSPAIADNAALAPDGAMTAASFSGAAGGAYLLTQNINVSAAQKYTLAVWMRGAVGGEKVRIDFKNQTSGGISGTLFTLTSGWKRYSVTLTADATAQRGFQLRVESGFGNPDFTFFMWNAMLVDGAVLPPDIVSPAGAQGVRLATDERAALPQTGAGTGTGLSILAALRPRHTGSGQLRTIAEISDGTAANRLALYMDTDDRPAARAVAGGTVLATAKLASALTADRAVLAVSCDPANGLRLMCKAGLEEASTSLPGMLPGLAAVRLGADTGGHYLNGTIEQLQIARALSRNEAMTWLRRA